MKHDFSTTALVVCQGESVPRVSSRTVAEVFGKNHKYVLSKIHELLAVCPEEFNGPNFRPVEYEDSKGQWRPQYLLTRDAFCLLAMGFTGAEALTWKLRYIAAFNQLEETVRGQRLLSSPDGVALIQRGLKLSRRLTPERKLEIKRAVRYQALGLSKAEVGRLLGCGPTKAGNLLREHRWLKGGE